MRDRCLALLLALLATWSTAFTVESPALRFVLRRTSPFPLWASSSQPDSEEEVPKKNLVDQATFVESIETLKREVAKAGGMPDPTAEPESDDLVYVIGKLKVDLPIDNIGLDLTESGGLVLVSGVTEKTADDTGIQPLDTIVQVAVGDTYQESTKGFNLEKTAMILQTAVAQAKQKGMDEIELELNRLIKGYYG